MPSRVFRARNHKPRIGITMDWEISSSGIPRYVLPENYLNAALKAGAEPVLIPPNAEMISSSLAGIDGLIVSGGVYDSPSHHYVDSSVVAGGNTSPRSDFDTEIVRRALQKGVSVLGICAGMQVLGVALGGKLVRRVPDQQLHREVPKTDIAHTIDVEPGTQLAAMIGTGTIPVNSWHREAVATLPEGVTISARASDGTIEAIEVIGGRTIGGIKMPQKAFAVGVQWHPEYPGLGACSNVISAFVERVKAQQKDAPAL